MKKLAILVGCALMLYIPAAQAGHEPTTVKSFTGCLGTTGKSKGKVSKVKEGDVPLSACTGTQQEIHVSGGDITGVLANDPLTLTGSGTEGSQTLGLKNCSNQGDFLRFDPMGNSWSCGTETDPGTAFGRFDSGGALLDGLRMFAGTHPATGVYCVNSVLGVPMRSAVASLLFNSSAVKVMVQIPKDSMVCTSSNDDIEIRTTDAGGTGVDSGFTVAVN